LKVAIVDGALERKSLHYPNLAETPASDTAVFVYSRCARVACGEMESLNQPSSKVLQT